MIAHQSHLEGVYRKVQNDCISFSEEIAFYGGQEFELRRLENSYNQLYIHQNEISLKKTVMSFFDGFFIKYGATIIGNLSIAFPIFGTDTQYHDRIQGNISQITADYMKATQIMQNLLKAIGRIFMTYKEIQDLAGYTTRVVEMKKTFDNLNNGMYYRQLIQDSIVQYNSQNLIEIKKDNIQFKDYIELKNLNIITPNGDLLVKNMNLRIDQNTNVVISGPNGSGKSSLFRILGSLWPIFQGEVTKPLHQNVFYIPQRPYLPNGSLLDQIIYPHEQSQLSLFNIIEIIKNCELKHLLDGENQLGSVMDWNNFLAGGDKQKIAIARLIYHSPKFAILDECTSALSIELEQQLYKLILSKNITLFTISHRKSLFKFHQKILIFDGKKNYQYRDMQEQDWE